MYHASEALPILEEMLASGIEDRDAMVAATKRLIDVDPDEAMTLYHTQLVSFTLTKVRDDFGRRLIYQVREGGRRLALHIGRTTNYELVRKIGRQKKTLAVSIDAEANRLLMIADQLELDFGAGAA